MTARKYQWTQDKLDFLGAHYDGRVKNRAGWIAQQFGRPSWVVKRKAAELGLCFPADRRPWSDQEVVFLNEYLKMASVNWIAKKLGRSYSSVALKCRRLHIKRAEVREGYTLRALERCFRQNHKTIGKWVKNGWLKTRRRGINRDGFDYWYCSNRDVLEFIIAHPLEFRLD